MFIRVSVSIGQHIEISEDILRRYDVNAPRYTSYPTSPWWNENFAETDFRRVAAASNHSGRPLSLYMHLPFCDQMCLFCGCNAIVRHDHQKAAGYLSLLAQEIDLVMGVIDTSRPVVQFHWGGGTPTYFSPDQLATLFAHTAKRVHFADDAEIGVEIDPRVTSVEHLDTLRELGFNRLSLGVQDFDPTVQRAVRRIQPFEMVQELTQACRTRGFASINYDLMYGLPYQTPESFSHTLDEVLTLRPDRIAMFSYGHVPWVKRQQQALEGTIPLGRDKFQLFAIGLERLTKAGYVYVGMDHFALPDDELCVAQRDRSLHRNFQGYTTKDGADLFGMGITAIGGLERSYTQNVRGLKEYRAALDNDRLPVLRGVELTDEDVIRRAAISDLLCFGSLRKEDFGAHWGVDFDAHFSRELADLAPLIRDGLVEPRDDAIVATPLGNVFIRVIAAVFDEYLRRPGDGPRHSHTV